MILVRVVFENQQFSGVLVTGHENKKIPLICNSVSILTQTLVQSCFDLIGSSFFEVSSHKGLIDLKLVSEINDDTDKIRLQTLISSYLLGIKGLLTKSDSELNLDIIQA